MLLAFKAALQMPRFTFYFL